MKIDGNARFAPHHAPYRATQRKKLSHDMIYRLLRKGNWAYAGQRLATDARNYPKLLSFSEVVFVDSGDRVRKLHMRLGS